MDGYGSSPPEDLDGDTHDDSFTSSPVERRTRPASKNPSNNAPESTSSARRPLDTDNQSTTTSDRDAALRAELESLRRINTVVEGVLGSLERAKSNMNTVSRTVSQASTLLDTWTRILSQTEHNQRLILNPNWQGASQDIADAENQTLIRQRAQEAREAAEAKRKEALEERKRLEEEKRSQAEAAGTATTPTAQRRGRGRGRVRGTDTSTRGVSGGEVGGNPATAVPKAPTGRGAIAQYGRIGSVGTRANSRGRGRGVG